MNISLAPHAAAGVPGTPGKSGKSGDPLADFMAMLTELGITVEEDGTLAASATPATPGAQDIAAKLLDKLGKKSEEGAPQAKPGAVSPELATGDEDSKQDDPITTLTDLLTRIDPEGTKGAETVKPDVATLIAAVRVFTSDTAVPSNADAKPADPDASRTAKPDVATLIAAVRVFASDTAVPSNADAKPADPDASRTASVTAAPAPSIAALLSRGSHVAGGEKTVAPGTVQSAFARLEALVSKEMNPGNGKAPETVVAAAPDVAATDQNAAGEKTAVPEKSASATKLTELLARLTASVKPGAGQIQSAATPQAAPHAVRPQADPQIAAITRAIQNAAQDDRPVSETTESSAGSPVSGLSAITAPPAPARTDALPATDIAQANPAEELVNHHLDLARDTQWLDTLARDIARAAQSDTQLRFQLNPEHLGSLKVELVNGANGTSVKLTADTEAARAILADAQPRLVAEARAQGLRISEAHVDLSGHGGGQRHMAETPVMIRTANGATVAEVEQDKPAASGERYA